MKIEQRGWLLGGMIGLSCLSGCAEDGATVQRASAQNSTLAHDNARLQRDVGECRRELQRAQKQLADAQTATAAAQQAGQADHDAILEMRQALQQMSDHRDAAVKAQDELSRRLLESEKIVAQRAQELGRAAKAVRQQQDRITELTQELEALKRELAAASGSPSTGPSKP